MLHETAMFLSLENSIIEEHYTLLEKVIEMGWMEHNECLLQ